MTLGVSRAALSRSTGYNPRTIRKALASGLLTPAVLSDGSIDADLASTLLADGLAGQQKHVGDTGALLDARRRKLMAQIRVEEDRVRDLRSASILVDDEIKQCARDYTLDLATRLFALASECHPVVGLTSQDAHLCVRDRLYALMTELADEAEGDDEDLFELDECDAEDLEALPTVVLAEKLVALQAEFLEIRRAVKRGQRLDLDQYAEEETTRVMTCRQRLLAMPSKLASSLSICSTEAEAERLILDELEDGVRELASKWVSRADILACRPGVATMKTKPKESVLLPRDQQETLIRESIAQARKVLAPARAEEA